MNTRLLTLLTLLLFIVPGAHATEPWKEKLEQQLPLLGHRNWIVVVDAAYPLQTAPGIETVYAGADQLEVVKGVIASLAKTQHVKPTIYLDAELKFVAEKDAPGIGAYREELKTILAKQPATVLPHEQIIAKLDEAGKTFKVLVIKTPLTKPYTSVFFQLECGYWNADSEKRLRDAMKAVDCAHGAIPENAIVVNLSAVPKISHVGKPHQRQHRNENVRPERVAISQFPRCGKASEQRSQAELP